MKTYREYRLAGLSRLEAIRGQIHSWKLAVWYAPSSFRYLWLWKITLPRMKRRQPEKFKETMERMREAIDLLKND